jgi:hypothetical protein
MRLLAGAQPLGLLGGDRFDQLSLAVSPRKTSSATNDGTRNPANCCAD